MPSVPTILLALDQPASSETKIAVAIEYARMMGARLVLLHVLPAHDLNPQAVLPSEASARTYLDTVSAQVHATGIGVAKWCGVGRRHVRSSTRPGPLTLG